MFGKKNKLIKNLERQKCELYMRVKMLEERLCPLLSHEWMDFESEFDGGTQIFTYICKRCGKEYRTIHPLLATASPNRSENT